MRETYTALKGAGGFLLAGLCLFAVQQTPAPAYHSVVTVQAAQSLAGLIQPAHQAQITDAGFREKIDQQRLGLLPTGVQKHLIIGKPIPDGILKEMVPLPPSFNKYLGLPERADIRLGVVGTDVVIFNPQTYLVLDVLYDILEEETN